MPRNKPLRRAARLKWARSRAAESGYVARLRAVAKQVGMIVRGMAPDGSTESAHAIVTALQGYAKLIEPWAASVSKVMVADVAMRDKSMWRQRNAEIGRELSLEISKAPTGAILSKLQQEQVKLITSLPLDAAERVHLLSQEALVSSARAKEIAAQIYATGEITESRAKLIARTEVARVSSNLVQARSQYAGSDGYVWRTSEDADVRESHSRMEGVYVRWSVPPKLDNMIGHAGTLPNCRCFAEPIFPDQ
jgi:SPP1 gp7 family putative phage head morphogenesis protein